MIAGRDAHNETPAEADIPLRYHVAKATRDENYARLRMTTITRTRYVIFPAACPPWAVTHIPMPLLHLAMASAFRRHTCASEKSLGVRKVLLRLRTVHVIDVVHTVQEAV